MKKNSLIFTICLALSCIFISCKEDQIETVNKDQSKILEQYDCADLH